MPAKNKGGTSKGKEAEAKQQVPAQRPKTIREFEWQLYWSTNPLQKIVEEQGFAQLSPADKRTYLNLGLARSPGQVDKLSKKGQRELWKHTLFKFDRGMAHLKTKNEATGEIYTTTEDDIKAEKARRQEIAYLHQELYGTGTPSNSYVEDPEWDDVVPIPQEEPEGALSTIAYEEDYADAMAYLRAVMAVKEYSPRCLRLTENIIDMNPAHYTVWLYRLDIVKALEIPIQDELKWLNEVSFQHLKNYQIWHHRQQLIDVLYPTIQSNEADVATLALDEHKFIMEMLSKDTKNYHVWSYRQYLVRKLNLWNSTEEEECINEMLTQDVRNNSAWSHRFFVVFNNPGLTTPGLLATEPDRLVTKNVIDREIEFAQVMIKKAPQNQSPWNYLRGVLVKGGRPLGDVRVFVEEFVNCLGGNGGQEEVLSSHALDLLADIYNEAGEKDKAALCLSRLGEKWDRIRGGYWAYRQRLL
ncbi:putative geranylgeranyltransferase type I alpha subunit [Hypoxylon argillaceum]|nr:putative geranylgeranyltransferase type I alpha subunit [Hypoxylon argillaceum]